MILTIRQEQLIIERFNNLNINPQVQNMAVAVSYVPISFEGNMYYGDPQGIKIYLQVTKETENEADKLDISV